MNPHYLELMEYLELLSHYPLDPEQHVFASAPGLYSGCKKINHKLHNNYLVVCDSLYSCNDVDDEVLEMVKAVATSVADKLQVYNVTSYQEVSCGTPQRGSYQVPLSQPGVDKSRVNQYWGLMTGSRRALPTLFSEP